MDSEKPDTTPEQQDQHKTSWTLQDRSSDAVEAFKAKRATKPQPYKDYMNGSR